MSDENHIKFHQLFEAKLNTTLKQKFLNEQLTPASMRLIREEIRKQLVDVFSSSTHRLSPKAMIWLGDQYFKGVRLNGDQLVGDQVIINEYSLSELEYSDITLLRKLFGETTMGQTLDNEFLSRSLS